MVVNTGIHASLHYEYIYSSWPVGSGLTLILFLLLEPTSVSVTINSNLISLIKLFFFFGFPRKRYLFLLLYHHNIHNTQLSYSCCLYKSVFLKNWGDPWEQIHNTWLTNAYPQGMMALRNRVQVSCMVIFQYTFPTAHKHISIHSAPQDENIQTTCLIC